MVKIDNSVLLSPSEDHALRSGSSVFLARKDCVELMLAQSVLTLRGRTVAIAWPCGAFINMETKLKTALLQRQGIPSESHLVWGISFNEGIKIEEGKISLG